MLNPVTARKIRDFCDEFSLCQSIQEPTHFTASSSSLIDILLVKDVKHLIKSGVGEPFLQNVRFHCPIYGIFNFSKPKKKSYMRHIWMYDRADFDLLRQKAADFDWASLRSDDINIYANNITEKVFSLSIECIPNKQVRIRPSEPVWMTSIIRHLIRKRKRAFRKAKLTDTPANWEKFRKLRNKVISLIRESKKNRNEQLTNTLRNQRLRSKDWWTTLKTFISPLYRNSNAPLEKDGIIYSESIDKANLLNDYFRDQTLLDEQNATLPNMSVYNGTILSNFVITEAEVKAALLSLPLGIASGPDDINNRVLQALATELSPEFTTLFNQSLQQSDVPDIWKISHVCPVSKGGDVSSLSNNRPISLLNNIDKTFERIVFKHLYSHFHDNDILTPLQFGFIPGDSTVNQLTFLYDTFCKALYS